MASISNVTLRDTLEKFCERMMMSPEDKEKAVDMVMTALDQAYPEGIPQDVLTDPSQKKNLLTALLMAPLMEKIPELRFDLTLFFKAELKPQEVKSLFKTFLMELNKLEPDPKKRRTEKEIDDEVDALFENIKKEQAEKNETITLMKSKVASDALDQVYIMLFGMTQHRRPIPIPVNKGNTSGFIDSYSASALGGGSIHEGRAFSGDTTTDAYVIWQGEQRLAAMSGLGTEEIIDLQKRGILPSTPQNTIK